jgi:hypothetical protein
MRCSRALSSRFDLKLHLLAFLQRPEACGLNVRLVHKKIVAITAGDEPVPFFGAEPLYGANKAF